jgi:type II secretory pathway pseudopilin PulG
MAPAAADVTAPVPPHPDEPEHARHHLDPFAIGGDELHPLHRLGSPHNAKTIRKRGATMSDGVKDFLGGTVALVVVVVVIFGVVLAFMLGIPSYNRSQARANAANRVKVTHIEIQNAHQEALITHAQIEATRAKADKRIVEAEGIAVATKDVDKTLTPLYIEHEAVQAQEAIATSGNNNTIIYVPAGTNGTPLITQSANGLTPRAP